MKRTVYMSLLLIIVLLIAISVYNYTLNSILVKENYSHIVRFEIDKQSALSKEKEVSYLFNQSIQSSGLVLRNIFVVNEIGSKVRLNSLFDNKPKLVLRFSEINCMTCVDSSLVYIEKYKNIIGSENIIILSSYKRQHDVNTFKRISEVNFEIFNTGDSTLGLPIENGNTPFMFVTNRELKTQSVFLPEKTMPLLTDNYFKAIISRHFSNKN